jgi:hypothetical protein
MEKYPFYIPLIIILLVVIGCQPTPPPIDPISIQNTTVAIGNTAVAMAWTGVAQTQIASTPPTPRPTAIPFVMPKGDFQMSWDSYNSEYNSFRGIITITKKGSNYMEKIVMSDGSNATYNLRIISEGSVIKLDGHFGNSYSLYPHDYIQIESNGWLGFYDEQGLIYRVPPLK